VLPSAAPAFGSISVIPPSVAPSVTAGVGSISSIPPV